MDVAPLRGQQSASDRLGEERVSQVHRGVGDVEEPLLPQLPQRDVQAAPVEAAGEGDGVLGQGTVGHAKHRCGTPVIAGETCHTAVEEVVQEGGLAGVRLGELFCEERLAPAARMDGGCGLARGVGAQEPQLLNRLVRGQGAQLDRVGGAPDARAPSCRSCGTSGSSSRHVARILTPGVRTGARRDRG